MRQSFTALLNEIQSNYFRFQGFLASGSLNRKRFIRLNKRLKRHSSLLAKALKTNTLNASKVGVVSLSMLVNTQINAQIFADPIESPFGLVTEITKTSFIGNHDLVDLDNDGDYDILAINFYESYVYYENIGTPSSPLFAEPQSDPFGLSITYDGHFAEIELVDLDNDGDFDILESQTYGLFYRENIGNAEGPNFAPIISNPFGINEVQYLNTSTVDLDSDGDLDILCGSYQEFVYYENTGTSEIPTIAEPVRSPFGLPPENYQQIITADWDNDGDLDVIYTNLEFVNGLASSEVGYYENIGDQFTANFAEPVVDPFNLLIPERSCNSISAADMDDDGDLDIIAFSAIDLTDPVITYHENVTNLTSASDVINDANVNVFPTLTLDRVSVQSAYPLTSYEVFDMSGKMLSAEVYTDSEISLKAFASGIYYIKLNVEGGGFVTKRVVKE